MGVLEQNCDPNLPIALCVIANVCGYISNVIWFFNLLPQIIKNYRRRSTVGLSFTWASCNFCASLINLFFIIDIDVPLFTRISGWYMPILEFTMLLQFALYSKATMRRKLLLITVCSALYSAVIALECTRAFGDNTSSSMVWASIVLWSIETYFQLVLNMKRRSVDGQSYLSMGLSLIGKTTDVIMQYTLLMPKQYVYMTYFSSTFAYFNIMQILIYMQRRWYTRPVLSVMSILLCGFVALLLLRTSVISILCPIGVVASLLAGFFVTRRQSRDLVKETHEAEE